ncbi:uncharacterized protein LOC142628532 [Castanea sativa]|uniref:uncharacterized protein LOC142628532 n=1 Tax=Castanea sativa TaxID=21020 RepID=UPI003F64B2B8
MASDPTTLPQTVPQIESSSQNISSSSMVDESANNPYFLPVAENPGIILSLQPLIGPENYADWTRSVFLALSERNKFAFVNGAISKPKVTSTLYNSWCRCNTMILSWLVNSLSKDLQESVRYINTARELWIDLQDHFSQGSSPRFDKTQVETQQKEHAFCFLMGLNDSFDHITNQILIVEPLPSINKVCCLILQEEKRRIVGHGVNVITEPTALYANNSYNPSFNPNFRPNQGQGFHGGKGGNLKKQKLVCTYCGLTGHIVDKCYKLHGYPPGYKPKGNRPMANQVFVGFQSDGSMVQGPNFFPNGNAYGGP